MEYAKFNDTIINKVLAALVLINNPEIDPEIRQLNQEILFREVGASVYEKVYEMNAFDYQITNTKGVGMDDRHFGLAKVVSASISTGAGIDRLVRSYLDNAAGKAQADAAKNAVQSGQRAVVYRTLGRTEKTCQFCEDMAGGSPYTGDAITGLVFAYHADCDCVIRSEGFESRNGVLKGANKRKKA